MISLALCAVLAQAEPTAFQVSASGGVAVFAGQVAPSFSLTPGPFAQVGALYRNSPRTAVGLGLDTMSGALAYQQTDLEIPLADLYRSGQVLMVSVAAVGELRPWGPGRVSPFAAGRLGWQFAAVSHVTHGPLASVALGVDFEPWAGLGLLFGLAATETMALLSNDLWSPLVNGYALRPDSLAMPRGSWGTLWVLSSATSFTARISLAF